MNSAETTRCARWLVLVLMVLLGTAERADACACCDAQFSRAVIGWSTSGDVLMESADGAACEFKVQHEVWRIGEVAPTSCYDLLGDPSVRQSCNDIVGTERGGTAKRAPAVLKEYARRPALSRADYRVVQRWLADERVVDVAIEVKRDARWSRAWQQRVRTRAVSVRVWKTPQEDTLLALLEYRRDGDNGQAVDVLWLQRPR